MWARKQKTFWKMEMYAQKVATSTPCTSHRALPVVITSGITTCCQAMHLSSTLCCRWEGHQGCVSLCAIQQDV